MNIFGIGLPEMVVIAAIGLLVFGPKRLPELGKTLGRTLRGFQRASQDFEQEFRTAMTPMEPLPENNPPPSSIAAAASTASTVPSPALSQEPSTGTATSPDAAELETTPKV